MKRYGTVKIQNPTTDGHSIRLLPFQPFEIVFSKYSPTDIFDVSLLSDFLTLVERQESPTHVTYKFEQKYDFTEWVGISNLFLGNVVVNTKSDKIRLCVYCIGNKDSVLTVINPEGLLIKIEPHQLLHIVCYNKNDESVQWKIDELDSMKCVRCETVINDFPKVYDKEVLFCPESRSNNLPRNSSLKESVTNSMPLAWTTTEYHFWLCLGTSEFIKLHGKSDGCYPLGFISLLEESKDYQSVNRIELILNFRSKKRFKLDNCHSILRSASQWRERSISYSRRSLLNPFLVENISIADSDGWFYLEIPTPKYYFPFSGDCDWKPGRIEQIKCFELKPRFVQGAKIQRFLLSGIIQNLLQIISLGSITFIVDDSSEEDERELTINFWKSLLPPVEQNSIHIGKHRSQLVETSKMEVELELINNTDLTSDADEIVSLSEISDNEYFEYNEFMSGHCVPMYDYSKKHKFPTLVISTTTGDSTSRYINTEADE